MRAVPLTVAVACVALVAACSSPVQRVPGEAAPAGPDRSATVTPAATTSAPSPAASTPSAASAKPVVSAAAKPPAASSRVLGPFGLGALKLGMTRTRAQATGLVDPFVESELGSSCGWETHLKGASGDELAGWVLDSKKLHLVAIYAYPGISTPEGIRIGSSKAALQRAYPEWFDVTGDPPGPNGRGFAKPRGNSNAVYRIVIFNNKVVELAIQFKNQDCYE